MSFPGPILPILGPVLVAGVALLLGRWPRARTIAGVTGSFIIAGWIAALSLDSGSDIGPGLFAGDTWLLLGRPFVLTESVQSLFVFLWIGLGILFLLALLFPQDPAFVPAALAAFSPLAAAFMVELFSIGAVFLTIAVAMIVMSYKPQQFKNPYGALRYLLIFTLSLPLLLLVGWLFESQQATFFSTLVVRVLALAVALLLAGFPFYIWVYPLVAEAPLLFPALIFGLMQTAVISFLLSFLWTHPWLQHDPQFLLWLRWSGAGTVLVASVLILTAVKWRFLMAHLLLLNMGMSLLALTLPAPEVWEVSLMTHLARFVSLLLAGMAMCLLERQLQSPIIADSRGLGRQNPLGFVLLVYSFFSLVGTPLTPGFFPQWAIIAGIGHQANVWLAVLLVLALTISVYAVLRVLIVPFGDRDNQEQLSEVKYSRWMQGLIVLLLILAVSLALLPQPLLTATSSLTGISNG
ncbi:MAG: proton-conducting transporter membrane subunit [Candidatus Promineifilaceae bacterium]|nr:proton-conducting transporter membrane subunit [Candidatus Promineifilaceae bacterium]